MGVWVGSAGESVMVPRETLDTLLEALAPGADDKQRQEARQLIGDLDDSSLSRRGHDVEPSSP
jgi:hypothetical protein